MKIFKRYINFSKALIFSLVIAFFAILAFDGWVIVRLINLLANGVDLAYAAVLGTICGTMSTFSSAVILFAVKGYLSKSEKENVAGYDAKTNTIAEERIAEKIDFSAMYDPCNNEGGI